MSFDDLPIFATDDELAQALLGARRACEWRAIVEVLERRGFPPVDLEMGGRYKYAVLHFWNAEYGLGKSPTPLVPDGTENPDAWRTRRKLSA